MSKNGHKSVVLWHMNGSMATIYQYSEEQKKRVPLETISFVSKAYLAFRKIDELRIVSAAIPFLIYLYSLRLQSNQLTSLPNEIWRLENLIELNLGHNQLTSLPKEVGLLVNLQELYVHNNQIKKIPSQLANLKQLTILDLTENLLSFLPNRVHKLKLKQLWIDNNPFDAVPTTTTKQSMSLKSICEQTIGSLCMTDDESREAVIESILMDKQRLIPDTIELVEKCDSCSLPIFHEGLDIIKLNNGVPVLFKACSQTCHNKI
ncbi:uncharacterized protein B0P05DRAFT_564039 [Gilbertella persicaria]|uniref:Uncharacterized protein n=1 Tax=Rhizopus stolonifer TaxID=4846 RepID=A0A367KW17_RHIST|nr:uncharacterized protein B0P05DRAFT_564039 [Gilbertella persicaria]KAI8048930.1 hypothetical protein B0P05DRAFT_564039 [Gilbertella persicaria]RCI06409.1 hypothetical protein CU098_013378 [Rhizopus stolonifer]